MHTILAPHCHRVFLSKPNSRMSIHSILTQMSQIKLQNITSSECVLNHLINLSCFFVYTVVSWVKPQVKLSEVLVLLNCTISKILFPNINMISSFSFNDFIPEILRGVYWICNCHFYSTRLRESVEETEGAKI